MWWYVIPRQLHLIRGQDGVFSIWVVLRQQTELQIWALGP